MKVAVIGAGKMGLPIACQLGSRGAMVIACDVNKHLVAMINSGECPFEEPGLAEMLEQDVAMGTLVATTDTAAAVKTSEVVIVIVPVLLNTSNEPDLRQIHSVALLLGTALAKGSLVIFETTLPVGTTRGLLRFLEAAGLRASIDFDLVFSPERVKSQFVLTHLVETPKVIGGLTPGATKRAMAFYRHYLGAPVIDVGSLEAAEFVKLAGMVYRDVNIALATELARYADAVGVDFEPIAAAANTDGEAMVLLPGIGVGGHCTPVYPHFLLQDAARRGVNLGLTELGRQINEEQPLQTIQRLEAVWGPVAGRRVVILGLGFRPGVKEHTCSPAFHVRDALLERGAEVELCDPLYSDTEIETHGFVPGQLDSLPAPDAIILVTAHPEFTNLNFQRLAARGLKAVVDGRNVWNPTEVRNCSVIYLGIGRRSADSESARATRPRPTVTYASCEETVLV